MAESKIQNPNVVKNFYGGAYDDDTVKNAMKKVFDSLTITDEIVAGKFANQGTWMYIAYKYSSGLYGMVLAIFYNGGVPPYILNVMNGAYSYRTVDTISV